MAKSINRVADSAQASAVDRAALPEAGRRCVASAN
jgi:hypothetical protein